MMEPLQTRPAAVHAGQAATGRLGCAESGAVIDVDNPERMVSHQRVVNDFGDRRTAEPGSSRSFPREFVASALTPAAQTIILLIPAIANGFPFLFADTGNYLETALKLIIPHDRPGYY